MKTKEKRLTPLKLYLSKDLNYFLVVDELNDMMLKEKLKEHLTSTVPYIWALKRRSPEKFSGWDGKKAYIDSKGRIPSGLWHEVYTFCKVNSIPLEIYGLSKLRDETFSYKEFKEFAYKLFEGHAITPYEYQIKAAALIIKNKFSQSEIATSAGKTLISYLIFMWLKSKGFKKHLIVVPRLNLITQLINDYNDYANGKYTFTYQDIMGESEKISKDVDFVVGTFQSLSKMPKSWYNEFDSLFVDECHYAKTSSIKTIISKMSGLKLKYGMSGTINSKDRDIMLSTQAYLGPIIQKISPEFLINNEFASGVKINAYKLNYLPEEQKQKLYELKVANFDNPIEVLNVEKDLVRNSSIRFNFITDLILKTPNNALVLFSDIKNDYGKRLYEYLKVHAEDKNVYYIDGSTKMEQRDYYKQMMEAENTILVASFGTLSTGISIKNIQHIFLTESYKSKTIVLQSIGRGMRKHESKEFVQIYDFIDDFRVKVNGRYKDNYVWKHGVERIKYYKEYYAEAKSSGLKIIKVDFSSKAAAKKGKHEKSLF